MTLVLLGSCLALSTATISARQARQAWAAPDGTAPPTGRLVVEFHARPDLSGPESIAVFAERGRAVFDALQRTAEHAQARSLALIASFRGASAESFWLANEIVVDGASPLLAGMLSSLPGVRAVRAEQVLAPSEQATPPTPVGAGGSGTTAADETAWGVTRIGADLAWARGVTGAGVAVGTIDTGVDYSHPALMSSYRGNLGDGQFSHDYNWWDPTGVCGPVPCDNQGHGTHTMGTIAGGDGPGPSTPDVGVAPGARWLAAKGCVDYGCYESDLLSSAQFMLAPTDRFGLNPDPSRRPHLVSNSWGAPGVSPWLRDVVQSWLAAGIVPVFAAGNSGPQCGTSWYPGSYPESFSVGATDANDDIADFSSRGPSPFDKPHNPDIAAPGVAILSSLPGGGYGTMQGEI